MPKFTLKVPHYHQDGPNCWWYVHRMILDYHRDSEDWLGAIGGAPNQGLPFDTAESVLRGLGYKRLTPVEFGMHTSTTDVMRILNEHGPLFIPCRNTFKWKAGHALVLSGVVENKNKSDEVPDDELVVLLDPAAKNKKSDGKIKWPLDYAFILMDLENYPSQTPFYYDGPDRRKIVSRGPDELPGFDDMLAELKELAESL